MSNKIWIFLFLMSLLCVPIPILAQDRLPSPILKIKKMPRFSLPINCKINEDCWVMNYVDFGADDQKKTDPSCLERTYDNHKGTDFALLDGAAMLRGVDVLSAADGTVSRLRNSEKDGWHSEEALDEIRENKKECGNGIFIDHGDGISTVYCHLKLNSIVVKKGARVRAGEKIAQVGQSGMTQFPHLHFGIIKEGRILDPFTGRDNQGGCGLNGKTPLWDNVQNITYQPVTIQAIGFLDKAPDFNAIEKRAQQISEIKTNSEAVILWATFLGVREGDKISLEILDPNGNIFVKQDIVQERARARQFYFVGNPINKNIILEGAYTGTVKIIRGNKTWHKASAVLVVQ